MVTASQILQKSKISPKPDNRNPKSSISTKHKSEIGKLQLIKNKKAIDQSFLTKENTVFESLQLFFAINIKALQINEPGVKLGTEPEYLHQSRIALRRIRVALISFKEYFPKELYKKLHTQLREIFKTLGKEREIDVLQIMLDAEKAKHPKKEEMIQHCFQWLRHEKERHHQTTIDLLDSEIYSQTFNMLQSLPSLKKKFPDLAFQPIGNIANGVLKSNWKMLRKQGNTLTIKSHDDSFHEMRISCKKLRYQCEFLRSILNENIPEFIDQLKALQATLGALQDMVTAQEALHPYVKMLQQDCNAQYLICIQKFLKKIDKKSRKQQTGFFVLWDKVKRSKPKLLFN